MKVNVKEVSPTEREMHFEKSWEDIEKDYKAFEKKFAKDIALPGFRKGMVPLKIIEKKFGPGSTWILSMKSSRIITAMPWKKKN
ncbi:MAG: trigger factor family protein [Candidatus Marinimicrobia bacterium]|nr:trigger factor family protein [Candidatus Neomarinimicrobiota bacterium]